MAIAAPRVAALPGVRLALFAAAHDHPRLVAHRAAGGICCAAQAGRLQLVKPDAEHDLGPLATMPLLLGGAAPYNLENICAAALAADAAGLPLQAIRQTLQQFGSRPQDNPGRLERWAWRGATVLLDYAHNPDGLAQLLAVAQALQPRRLGLLLGQAGNRNDAALAELAQTAARFAPDRVVLKELPAMLRGRAPGEVPGLLLQGLLAAGLPAARCWRIDDEATAASDLLQWAGPGDVLVLPVHTAAVRQVVTGWLQAGALSAPPDPA
jgi:UDP-N-acetylmuramyl tripeptide synthase